MATESISARMSKADDHCYVELSFAPSLELVSIVRRFVSQFFELTVTNPDATARLVVAVHELLENAVRFTVDGEAAIRIEVGAARPGEVAITTRNRASADQVAILARFFQEMKAATSPMDYYVQLMERTTRRDDGSQLGLGRVFAESRMELSHAVGSDGTVTVFAHMPAGGWA